MGRTITEHEMDRRRAMARAKSDMTTAMTGHSLTATEWICVLEEMIARMVAYGLKEEWADEDTC